MASTASISRLVGMGLLRLGALFECGGECGFRL